jgi:starvation-inducible DNA-binding protein
MTANTVDTGVVIGTLNRQVATASDLVSQLKLAHWNVVGPEFIALHELFDKQADLVRGYVDEFAERVRALDGEAAGTVRQAAEATALEEFPHGEASATRIVQALTERFEMFSALLTQAIREADEAGDLTTQDLYIEVQREIDRNAWFLRAHLR